MADEQLKQIQLSSRNSCRRITITMTAGFTLRLHTSPNPRFHHRGVCLRCHILHAMYTIKEAPIMADSPSGCTHCPIPDATIAASVSDVTSFSTAPLIYSSSSSADSSSRLDKLTWGERSSHLFHVLRLPLHFDVSWKLSSCIYFTRFQFKATRCPIAALH